MYEIKNKQGKVIAALKVKSFVVPERENPRKKQYKEHLLRMRNYI